MKSLCKMIKMLFDFLRDFINMYYLILAVSPFKKRTATMFGSVCMPTASISGQLRLYEPAWFQMNRDSASGSITMRKGCFLLIDHNCRIDDIDISQPSVFTSKASYSQEDLPQKKVTVSVDLEGAVGLSHAPKSTFDFYKEKWNSRDTTYSLYHLFRRHSIPVTWAICGHLFLESCNGNHGFDEKDWYGDWFTHDPCSNAEKNPDWYMPDFIQLLRTDTMMEIGYHSFGHFNYCRASDETIMKDLAWGARIREKFAIPMTTLVFPYNAVSHIEEVVESGFTCLRGYIGQYYLPMTVKFGSFTFYATSMFLGPSTIRKRTSRIHECIGKNFNYFLHPEDWVGKDLSGLEQWCAALEAIHRKELISLELFRTNG